MNKKTLMLSCGLLVMFALAVTNGQQATVDTDPGDANSRQQCVWNVGDLHKMHYPQLPDEDGWDVNATYPIIVADDWRCTDSGYVGDIHFWGSWRHDDIGEIVYFQVAVHSNIPADPPSIPYSRPANDFLWAFDLPIEWADVVPIQLPTPLEGWYDPTAGEVFYNDHSWYFQYNFCLSDWIDESQMFYQQENEIYWLEIIAVVVDPINTKWGWKSSEDHFMDDAVWADVPQGRDWQELYEPGTGGGEPIINEFWIEFDALGIPVPPTTGGTDYYDDGTSLNGWFYYQNTGWWNIWFYDHPFDPERYKEILIAFQWFTTSDQYYIEVAVNWATPDWPPDLPPPVPPVTPSEEDLYIHREFLPIAEPGFYEFPITVPDYNPEWVSVDVMGLNVIIPPGAGFIEHTCIGTGISMDMAFVITGLEEELDFGDLPDAPFPTLLASNGARHTVVPNVYLGQFIDAEIDGQPSPIALRDDNAPAALPDDEDGVVFTTLLVQGQPSTVKITASVTGFVNAWADWNADGDFDDPGEQIFLDEPVVAGDNLRNVLIPNAASGTTFSRFRFNTTGGLGYDGPADDGEVEDYRLFILEPIEDVKMHWQQTPDLDNTGMDDDINDFEPEWAARADDFRCTESGPITDVHLWLSFMNDILPPDGPGNLTFMLEVWTNIPEDQNPYGLYSMPGDPICQWIFQPGAYDVHQVCDNNPEDWHAYFFGIWLDDEHLNAYQYDFLLPDETCIQEEGQIYWLVLYDLTPMPHDYSVGWKTTERDLRFMDAAVGLIDPPNIWVPLNYPPGHEYFDEVLDYAFVITGGVTYVCGDADGSGAVDIDDVVYVINYIFGGGPPPNPLAAGDVDCSGGVDIDDVVYIINYIFGGGPPPCDPDGDGVPDC